MLADPQERAWYDSHSDAFLGTNGSSEGDQHSYNIRVTTAEDVLKVFAKFSPRMEFSDSPSGFFGGLNDHFSQLALEERLACQWEDQDMVDYPPFGTHDDDFETVVRQFYAAWSGFSTRKSFSWKDAYRLSDAPDRRVRRLMEKENRRLRDEAIREFNDAVRSLVAFIKKRDPRYKANALNEAQRQETLRQSVAAQAARSRAINQAKMREHVVPEWAQSEEPVANDSQESSESEVESFECVACHKHFKSQKQFEAHERSKKHLKAVKQLRREMLLQNEELDLEPAVQVDASNQTEAVDDDGYDDFHESTPLSNQPDSYVGREADDSEDIESSKKDQGHLSSSGSEDEKSIGDEDYAPRETIETRLASNFDPLQGDDSITPMTEQLSSSGLDDRPATPQVGKAKQKRAKKAARDTENSAGLICSNCNVTFASRNQLFAHIKKNPSHAQLQPLAAKGKRR